MILVRWGKGGHQVLVCWSNNEYGIFAPTEDPLGTAEQGVDSALMGCERQGSMQ